MEPKEPMMDYGKLAKQFGLPTWNEIDRAFDLGECKTLSDVRKKIIENLDSYANFLEELLQPEQSLSALYECKVFYEDEKKRIFILYRKVMFLQRSGQEIGLDNEDKQDAAFIQLIWKEWPSVKSELKTLVAKARDSWKDDTESTENPGYFG